MSEAPFTKTHGALADLLSNVLKDAHPELAKIDNEHWRIKVEGFLEDMETHAKGQITPILEKLASQVTLPPELQALIDEAIDPPEQFSAVLLQIFVFGTVSTLIGTLLTPFMQGVANDASSAAVADKLARPVDPSLLATAAARGIDLGASPSFTIPQDMYDQAAQSGVSADDLNLQASIVGLPPAFQELLEMKRRGIIDDTQLAAGLQQGDFKDDWIQYAVQLIDGWPTPTDFVRAAVQAQMSYADAESWANKTGLDVTTPVPIDTGDTEASPDMFGLLYGIAGRPPGPEELARMTLRGIIPQAGTGAGTVSFQQGIAESDVKVKYTDALWQLAQYIPPPRAIGTLIERGVISSQTGLGYYEANGVPTELAQAYVTMALQQSTVQEKLLAKGTVLTAYYDGILSEAQATDYLADLGFDGQVASELLAVSDFRREIQAINTVVRRIGSLYENDKIDVTSAQAALTNVGIGADQAQKLLSIWATLRVAPIRVPTVSEIGKAMQYGTITQATAINQIENLGYQPLDAQIVLSAYSEAPITPLASEGTTVTG